LWPDSAAGGVRYIIMQQAIFAIIILLFAVYALLIGYYLMGWKSIPVYQCPPQTGNPITSISIIIPARNEVQNIQICLDSICNQSYPKDLFEVLVIDDHSTDDTAAIILNYSAQNVKLISLKDFVSPGGINSYKKKAIEIAIQQSAGELIVTTDADCIAPEKWLQTIDAFYQKKNASFIAMPVAFLPALAGEGPWVKCIKIFQSLDFITLQGITGASVHKHVHSMCNGANLAYTRKAFDEVNGFKGIDNIASGDDMLLMHKIYKQDPAKVFFLKSKDVIVQTQPMQTVKSFFNQRIRWASKADQYDDKRIFAVLLMVYLFNVLLLVLPITALFNNAIFSFRIYPVTIAASVFECWLFLVISKTIIELLFLFPVARFFKQAKLLWWFPVMQPFHILYTVIAGWLGKFGSYNWKDRNVK
jgi:cellulose synthase/poly-beta-1,6-N-acetylglucosamine synthase-like glycosyltransferase